MQPCKTVRSRQFQARPGGRFFVAAVPDIGGKSGMTRETKVEDVPMYAIFKSGGRQFEAKPGAVVKVNKLPGEVGEKVVLDQVLLLADGDQIEVGKPVSENVAVRGHIVEQGRDKKIVIFKHKKRKDYRKKQGHRQDFTAVLVDGIGMGAEQAEASLPQEEALPQTEE